MDEQTSTVSVPNRWFIAVCGTLLQLCLGSVYAWSYFQNPLCEAYGWTNAQVAAVFSIAICFLGIAAAWGGVNLGKFGPRRLATIGGALFGIGYLVAAGGLHFKSLALLYLGYGVIGGVGLGLGYVTPVATAAKWFPDKKGLVTGMVVMGFGFGALLMSKVVAPVMVSFATSASTGKAGYAAAFAYIGVLYCILTPLFGSFLRNPPANWAPGKAAAGGGTQPAGSGGEVTAKECLVSLHFAMMWLVFFCNIAAGIAIICFQSPLFQDLWRRIRPGIDGKTVAAYGTTLIAVSSLFNGAGRFFWGGVSDRIGRANTFRIMLVTQVAAFVALVFAGSPWVFGALICYVLLCYGGGFGTMPSFVSDVFGPKVMATVYGAILTAWAAAGIAGPQVFGVIKDKVLPIEKASTYSFFIAAGLLAAGLVVSLVFLGDKRFERRAK